MTLSTRFRCLLGCVLPWPLRHQRKAAIEAARAARDTARRKAYQAAQVRNDIQRIITDNHFTQNTRDAFRGYPEAR